MPAPVFAVSMIELISRIKLHKLEIFGSYKIGNHLTCRVTIQKEVEII